MIYDELAMYDQCDSLYISALKIYPNNDLLMNNYAYSLAVRGINLNYALELSLKAIEAQPDNGAYLDTIGWIYFKLGSYNKALDYVKRAVDKRETSPVVWEHLGDIYHRLGDIKNAYDNWRKAAELDPDNRQLKEKDRSLTDLHSEIDDLSREKDNLLAQLKNLSQEKNRSFTQLQDSQS